VTSTEAWVSEAAVIEGSEAMIFVVVEKNGEGEEVGGGLACF
jgi:hypothetical protein